jgi:hypothetical protein
LTTQPQECGIRCVEEPRCLHFSWNNLFGGQCKLQTSAFYKGKTDAKYSNGFNDKLCGIISYRGRDIYGPFNQNNYDPYNPHNNYNPYHNHHNYQHNHNNHNYLYNNPRRPPPPHYYQNNNHFDRYRYPFNGEPADNEHNI